MERSFDEGYDESPPKTSTYLPKTSSLNSGNKNMSQSMRIRNTNRKSTPLPLGASVFKKKDTSYSKLGQSILKGDSKCEILG